VTVTTTAADTSNPSPTAGLEQGDPIDYPTKRDEAWRYAPHRELGRLSFGPPAASARSLPAEVEEQIPALDGPRIVVVNGVVDDFRSDLTDLPEGLRLSTLADALSEQPEQLDAHFDRGPDGIVDAFVALNMAFGRDGAAVNVDKGHELATPIHIVDVTIPDGTQNASCAGVAIHLGEGSSATVVETRIGGGSEFGGSNTRTTITLDDNATLDHILLQDVPSTQIQLTRIEVTQAAGSLFRAHSFNLGAIYGRVAYDVNLGGEGAHTDLSGLYFGLGDQTLDQQLTVIHAAKNCTSRQAFRGVLDNQSTGVFNGGIDVRPGADGTDAEQSNDNLLLSNRAEANTQPRLEILADDVACKHGATVGQLDGEALYYLRTRGISADEARRLLIRGFADQAVHAVHIEILRTWITDRLGHGDG
jgi:Fe-S cluster assembly protein SufD